MRSLAKRKIAAKGMCPIWITYRFAPLANAGSLVSSILHENAVLAVGPLQRGALLRGAIHRLVPFPCQQGVSSS